MSRFLLIIFLQLVFGNAFSISIEKQSERRINNIYAQLKKHPNLSIQERMRLISQYFIGRPYILGALGEGKQGVYDQWPLYRIDGFDCETFVDTVLALSFAQNFNSFEQCIQEVRYFDLPLSFKTRNHFTSLDWNLSNQHKGFTRDITETILDKDNKPVAKMATACIDKPSWYANLPENAIRILNANDKTTVQKKHQALQALSDEQHAKIATIPYIPLDLLFDKKGKPNQHLFAQIPDGSIVEIVRPNWEMRSQIGTNLNVSHMGLVFIENNKPIFREASSLENKVVDVELIGYLKNLIKSPTVRGINIQVVVPKEPMQHGCR